MKGSSGDSVCCSLFALEVLELLGLTSKLSALRYSSFQSFSPSMNLSMYSLSLDPDGGDGRLGVLLYHVLSEVMWSLPTFVVARWFVSSLLAGG